ncbi:MAG: three-Cys-motif partner protein TcmP, partial [Phycisphaeraceae bacterium]
RRRRRLFSRIYRREVTHTADRLDELSNRGVPVQGVFIEKDPQLFTRLTANLQGYSFPVSTWAGDFKDRANAISTIASTHSVFLYVDPIAPGDLLFNDLSATYAKLRQGQSVETLINFLSTGFVRRAQGLRPRCFRDDGLIKDHPEVLACNEIAGGIYWQDIVFDKKMSQGECAERVARGYVDQLRTHFQWVLHYPIRAKYKDKRPKYHLIFGSRHEDAVELMNRAMVRAKREFLGAEFVTNRLFPDQPEVEDIRPEEIRRAVVQTLIGKGRVTWKMLRVWTVVEHPCKYMDTEVNQAIKAAIRDKIIGATVSGQKIEDSAMVWPVT